MSSPLPLRPPPRPPLSPHYSQKPEKNKMKLPSRFIIFLCFLLQLINTSAKFLRNRILEKLDYQPVGGAIDSPTSDEYGGAIDISFDGNYVAVGSPHAGNKDQGEVKVYRSVFEDDNLIWEQVGNTIVGNAEFAHYGLSIALSWGGKKGATLAIGSLLDEDEQGSVEVFRYDDTVNTWASVHSILGENKGDNFGKNVELSSNGKILAVSGNSIAHVYKCYTATCEEQGSSITINGNATIRDIDLSSGGKSLAIGAVTREDAMFGPGTVELYKFQAGNWIPIEQEFNGEIGDGAGYSVSLSNNGQTIAFGSLGVRCADGTDRCGTVKIFSNDGASFTQVGDNIQGSLQSRLLGLDVDLTEDGRTLIVTSVNQNYEATATIYSNLMGETPGWTMIQSFAGNTIASLSSVTAAMSANGDRAIFLAPGQDGTNTNIVRIFGNGTNFQAPTKSSKGGKSGKAKSSKAKSSKSSKTKSSKGNKSG